MKKVLIIDDDTGIAEVLQIILESAGYRVETYTAFGEYIKQRNGQDRPDLIILDVFISGADGREICRKFRADKKTNGTPIIMMSANPETRHTTIEAGANEFIDKPFDTEVLLAKVQKHIY